MSESGPNRSKSGSDRNRVKIGLKQIKQVWREGCGRTNQILGPPDYAEEQRDF